jgi:plastocyanin
MKRLLALTLFLVPLALATTAFAHSSTTTVTIRHQTHGCHSWSAQGGAYTASLRLTRAAGTTLVFKNDDVMSHKLVQLRGPQVALGHALMNKIGATTRVVLAKPGVYVFGTKAGEDYMKGVKTVGEDNVLRLRVAVK